MDRLQQIILATLDLASISGLGNVSLQMIADKVGIRKASLFNHIKSKDDLLDKMYLYLREEAKNNVVPFDVDFSMSTFDILYGSYKTYLDLCLDPNLNKFYKLIYSERAFNNKAKELVLAETDRMVNSCKMLITELVRRGKLSERNIEMASISYAFTIHNYIDYQIDVDSLNISSNFSVEDYIRYFIGE